MLARFFIDRPVLAWVISLVIVLLGGISAALLPTAEYPEITPPTVQVTARYPGADAKVVADGLRSYGLTAVTQHDEVIVEDGKVKSFTITLSPESKAELEANTAKGL